MQRKILALAAAGALGAAMTTGAMAAHMGGGGLVNVLDRVM